MTSKFHSIEHRNDLLDSAKVARWKNLDATARFVGLGIELGLKMSKPEGREIVRQVFYLADKDLFEN